MASLSTFPLLSLPEDAILETARTMDIDEIICLSLVSKRCKQHVMSLNMKATSFVVCIEGSVSFWIESPAASFYLDFDEAVTKAGQKRKLKPRSVTVRPLRGNDLINLGTWKWTKFGYQDWLEHLWAVFHFQGIRKLLFINGSFGYDLDDIKKVFGKAKELYVEHTGCYDLNQVVFQKFSHIEKIRFNVNIFRNSKLSSNILIQNISQLYVLDFYGSPQTIKLNDLLMMNSKSIEFTDIEFSPKVLNEFIHLWMKGSNPNLEYLRIGYSTAKILNTTEVMKGITYEEVSQDERRLFICCRKDLNVYGGMDIQRLDGTRATIDVFRTDDRFSFEMFVWHDHCVVVPEDSYAALRALQAWIARLTELLNEAMREQ
ncbi:unnamed protein product [Caenorhabditis brenneri]